MSLLFANRELTLAGALEAVGRSMRSSRATPVVNGQTALRHSAVWACLRLRADLISSMPIDTYRRVAGIQTEVPKPPLLVTPDGNGIEEWMYSTQVDLDRYGNCFGIITERDANGLPKRIDLVPASEVTVRATGAIPSEYQVAGKTYQPEQVWHERQYTAPGLPVGLAPITYAAWSIGTYLSAQDFALGWFTSDAAPAGHLKNTLKPTIGTDEAAEVKARWKASIADRDVFVTGRDWEYTMNAVPANSVMFLDEMKYGISDVCRFFSVPGDMIDAETSTGSITYANVTQRNLQLLILNIGPAVIRREKALSRALPDARFAKLNTDAVLRMDPQTRSTVLGQQVRDRLIAPSEARALDNRPPFTDAEYAEFVRLFGKPADEMNAAEALQKAYLAVGKVVTSDEARQIVNDIAGVGLPIPGPEFPPSTSITLGVPA